jgi:hypothetical protein
LAKGCRRDADSGDRVLADGRHARGKLDRIDRMQRMGVPMQISRKLDRMGRIYRMKSFNGCAWRSLG